MSKKMQAIYREKLTDRKICYFLREAIGTKYHVIVRLFNSSALKITKYKRFT